MNLLARLIALLIYPFVKARMLARERALETVIRRREEREDAEEGRRIARERVERERKRTTLVAAYAAESRFTDCTHDVVLKFEDGHVVTCRKVKHSANSAWTYGGGNETVRGDMAHFCEAAVFQLRTEVRILPDAEPESEEQEVENEESEEKAQALS